MNPYDDSTRFKDTTHYLLSVIIPRLNKVFEALDKGRDGMYELGTFSKALTPRIKQPIKDQLKTIMENCEKENNNINRNFNDALSERHKNQIVEMKALDNNRIAVLDCIEVIVGRLDELNLLIDYEHHMSASVVG